MNPIKLKKLNEEKCPCQVGEKIKEKLYKTAEETFKNNKVYEKRKY